MLKFLVDTQLPPVLATYLKRKGIDAIHTTFFPEGHLLQDVEIRKIAINDNRIIITKDDDFLDSYLIRGSDPKVLLIQIGNVKNNDLIDLFENHLETLIHSFETGASLLLFKRNSIVVYE